jgi:hypothetical protein
MKLIDIILENYDSSTDDESKSEAAKEAARLGLIKKPGFGQYGPPHPNAPASHHVQNGVLVEKPKNQNFWEPTPPDPEKVAFWQAQEREREAERERRKKEEEKWKERNRKAEERELNRRRGLRAQLTIMPELPTEPPSPEEIAKVEARVAARKSSSTPPSMRVGPIAARILQCMSKSGAVEDYRIPVAAICEYYGRTTIPQIYTWADIRKEGIKANKKTKPDGDILGKSIPAIPGGILSIRGLYMSNVRDMESSEVLFLRDSIDLKKPLSEWEALGRTTDFRGNTVTYSKGEAFGTLAALIHESIHAVHKDALSAGGQFHWRDARKLAILEGVTEYMAQGIFSGIIENDQTFDELELKPDVVDGDKVSSYAEFVRPMRLMGDFGDLDMDYVMRNMNGSNEAGGSIILDVIEKAQATALETMLTKMNIEKSKIDELLELTRQGWANSNYLLSNNEVSTRLRTAANANFEIPDNEREALYETILNIARDQSTAK